MKRIESQFVLLKSSWAVESSNQVKYSTNFTKGFSNKMRNEINKMRRSLHVSSVKGNLLLASDLMSNNLILLK